MTDLCDALHGLFNSMQRFRFPFAQEIASIPRNGIYILFEQGERYGDWDRIVRVGTHNGQNQLHSRLDQHFVNPNKDRSIFRKNIGRCLLNLERPDYLAIWNHDYTSAAARAKNPPGRDKQYEEALETRITHHIQTKMSFVVFRVDTKDERLFWESRLIATIAACRDCAPSPGWLGLSSPVEKIKHFGLWQVNELDREKLSEEEFAALRRIITGPMKASA